MKRGIWTDIIIFLLLNCNIATVLYVIDLRMEIAKRDAAIEKEVEDAVRELEVFREKNEKR